MGNKSQDPLLGTVGWFELVAASIGVTAGQSVRVSVANLSASDAVVLCGVWQNPEPVSLVEDSYKLAPGEARSCDLNASDLPKESFDKTGRAQVRPFVRSSCRAVCANIEVFDNDTARTAIVLPLQSLRNK
jgi:hypothetical protein